MIGDHYDNKWHQPNYGWIYTGPTKEQFDELRKEVLEMKELLKKAIKYDEVNNEPECQIEEKMETLKKVAKMVGIDLDDILKK